VSRIIWMDPFDPSTRQKQKQRNKILGESVQLILKSRKTYFIFRVVKSWSISRQGQTYIQPFFSFCGNKTRFFFHDYFFFWKEFLLDSRFFSCYEKTERERFQYLSLSNECTLDGHGTNTKTLFALVFFKPKTYEGAAVRDIHALRQRHTHTWGHHVVRDSD